MLDTGCGLDTSFAFQRKPGARAVPPDKTPAWRGYRDNDPSRIARSSRHVRVFSWTAGGRVKHLAATGGAMVHRRSTDSRASCARDYQADRQSAAAHDSAAAAKAKRHSAAAITGDDRFLVWLERSHERGLTENCACRITSAGTCAAPGPSPGIGGLRDGSVALRLCERAQRSAAIRRASSLALSRGCSGEKRFELRPDAPHCRRRQRLRGGQFPLCNSWLAHAQRFRQTSLRHPKLLAQRAKISA